jgi:hypothetical protein
MVKDHLTEHIPFGNAMVNTHTYDSRMDIFRVEDEIPKLATFIAAAKSQTQNALWKYFGITQRAARVDTGSPETARMDLLLQEVRALRTGSNRREVSLPGLSARQNVNVGTAPKAYLGGRFRLSGHAIGSC